VNPFSIVVAIALFLGMVVLLEAGWQLGHRRRAKLEEGARAGLGAVEGAVFALMGLLVAFTFSGAAIRFQSHRELIVDEANAIGTAWLRLDLLPDGAQPPLRDLFRRYLDARITVYEKIPDFEAARADLAHANALQREIWTNAVAACSGSTNIMTAQLVLPPLNAMFDVAATRTATFQIHPPAIVFIMMAVLALMSALLAGYAMAGGKIRSWIHVVGFAFILAATVHVILDLEYPRLGLIRANSFDRILVDLRKSMN
jgi:hypothetical protein